MSPELHMRQVLLDNCTRQQAIDFIARHLHKANNVPNGLAPKALYRLPMKSTKGRRKWSQEASL